MKVKVNLPTLIKQTFDPDLLLNAWDRMYLRRYPKIKKKADRKIRIQDVGRRREFEILEKELGLAYERKKIEKEKYDAEIKEAIQKRSDIPNASITMRLKRSKS